MQKPMHDAIAKLSTGGELVVYVKRVVVARQARKGKNVIGCNRATDNVTLTDGELIEAITQEIFPSAISPNAKPAERGRIGSGPFNTAATTLVQVDFA
jgi:hypothetical protein